MCAPLLSHVLSNTFCISCVAYMRVSWINGWGILPSAMQPLSDQFSAGVTHEFLVPSASCASQCSTSDVVIGWSLGALRILDAAAAGVSFTGQVWLLAPFLDFCSEQGMGGRCTLSQVKWLRRWLTHAPGGANGFLQSGGTGARTRRTSYSIEELLCGLDRLMEPRVSALRRFVSRGLPQGWLAVIGEFDPLLNAKKISEVLPGCRTVPGADHRAGPLLRALMEPACAV
jgi:hypothetical protein